MRAVVVIVIQESIGALLSQSQVGSQKRGLTELLAAEGAIKTFNEGLVILLIGAGHHMLLTMPANRLGKVLFKPGATISLDDTNLAECARKDFQSCLAILGGQTGAHPDQYICHQHNTNMFGCLDWEHGY